MAGPALFPLRQLYFYLTEGCNLACRHCWLGPGIDTGGDRRPTLPVELFETAIREAGPLGLSGVKLTGGEPLLHPRFTQLLAIVRREKLQLAIETNGLLCTPEIAREIARSPDPFVSVSLDGADATTHDAVRRVPGAFDGTRRAIGNLVAAGVRPHVVFTVMRRNAGQVDAFVEMAEEFGAASVKFNIVQPTSRGEALHRASETLSVPELIELGQRVERELAPGARIPLFFDFPIAFRALSRIAGGEGCGVCGITSILGVMADGHYALCGIGEHAQELVFGEVGEDSLQYVWETSPVLSELREGLPGRLKGICSRCLMKGSCRASCIAQNYYRSESVWAPFWFCTQAEEAGRFPSSRTTERLT